MSITLEGVTGITLESEPTPGFPTLQDVVVYLEFANGQRRVELIRALRTGEGIISHTITGLGIEEELKR